MKTFSNVKIVKLLLVIAIFTLTISSCKKIEPEVIVEGDAKIRVINTVSGSNAQDVYQNATKLTTSSIAYGEVTNYLTVKGGISTALTLKNKDTDIVSATAVAGLQVNSSYTVFYYSTLSGEGRMNGLLDDNTVPVAGKSKVRFINLGSALSNTINISLASGTSIITGLAYEYATSYRDIDAGTGLNVTVVGAETTAIPNTVFQSGKIYTVWFDAANNNSVNYHVVTQN